MLSCCVCGSPGVECLVSLDCGNLKPSSLYRQAQIVCCADCGHVYNGGIFEDVEAGLIKYYQEESSVGNLSSPSPGDIPGSSGAYSLLRYGAFYDVVKEFSKNTDRVLDVGCASGGYLLFLQQKGYTELFGADLCPTYVVEAGKKKGITIKQGVAEAIPYDEAAFDVVVADQVAEHLFDPNKFFVEAKRVLKPGGYLCLNVPDANLYGKHVFFDFYWFLLREHIQHWDEAHLGRMAGKHGFVCEKVARFESPMLSDTILIPKLMMIFRKAENVVAQTPDFALKDSLVKYIEECQKNQTHVETMRKLCESQIPIYIWGMSREFLYLYENTDLRKCNIVGLLDDTPFKQLRTVNNMPILPIGNIPQAPESTNVLITSFAHKELMIKRLRGMDFKGNIL